MAEQVMPFGEFLYCPWSLVLWKIASLANAPLPPQSSPDALLPIYETYSKTCRSGRVNRKYRPEFRRPVISETNQRTSGCMHNRPIA